MADRIKKHRTGNMTGIKNGSMDGGTTAGAGGHSGHNSVGNTKIKEIFPNVQRIGGNKSV